VLTGAGNTAVPDERWLDGLDKALAEVPEGQRHAVACASRAISSTTLSPTPRHHAAGCGCRSLRSDGRHWRCYLGEEAVRQRIVGGLPRRGRAIGRRRLTVGISPFR
jgi:hypothetical protein